MQSIVYPRPVCVRREPTESPQRSPRERDLVARHVEVYRRRVAAIESKFGRNAARMLGAAAAAAFAAASAFGVAGAPSQQAKLTASDAADYDSLGISVAASGDTAIVGAFGNHAGQGAAYVFARSGTAWAQQAKLTAADAVDGDAFGRNVAVAGDTALIGAASRNSAQGAVYVFTRTGTTWKQQARLIASDSVAGDSFGRSVAVTGRTLVVGAYNKNSAQGAAYVFTRAGTTWKQQAKLTASDAADGDAFGRTIAVVGDTAVVGALNKNTGGGGAYVFTRSGTTWTQQAKLVSADATGGDGFGWSVAFAGASVVVGAPFATSQQGAAYVFTRTGTTWTRQAKLTAADAADGDAFGRSVRVAGDTLVVGASGRRSQQGAAYVFVRSGTIWTQATELSAGDAADGDSFGWSVALSGDTAFAGAYQTNSSRGAAYVFTGVASSPGYALPTSVKAKLNAAHPERSTVAASGAFDTGSGRPEFSGAATFDVGGFHLDVPEFVAKRKALTFSDGVVALTITPARSGSSRALFTAKAVGDLTGKIGLDAPLTFRFTNAAHDVSGTATLTKGVLGPHCLAAPDLCLRSAAATLAGSGKDALKLTLGFPTDGIPPALGERDLTIGFGDTYASQLLAGTSFVLRRNAYVFTAKPPGISKVVVDYAKGTITIAGSRLDLGAFAAGANPVVVTITRGGESRSVAVRMARAGSKLTY